MRTVFSQRKDSCVRIRRFRVREEFLAHACKSDDLLDPMYHDVVLLIGHDVELYIGHDDELYIGHKVELYIDHDEELYVDHDEYIGMVLFIYHGEDICTVVLLRRNIRLPGPVAVIEKVPVARSG